MLGKGPSFSKAEESMSHTGQPSAFFTVEDQFTPTSDSIVIARADDLTPSGIPVRRARRFVMLEFPAEASSSLLALEVLFNGC